MPRSTSLVLVLFLLIGAVAASRADSASWHIAGDLSEACTCSVPCTCNFGESPSPHSFCWALFSVGIKDGSYGTVDLSGLRLAGASGGRGLVWYIDERASKEQETALRSIANEMYVKMLRANKIKSPKDAPAEYRVRAIKRARIEQIVKDDRAYLRIGDKGVFVNDYIMGLDGKTPVMVENNWSWNIQHGIKGKTKRLAYHDEYGNQFEMKGTNANQGTFDWTDSTPIYFR